MEQMPSYDLMVLLGKKNVLLVKKQLCDRPTMSRQSLGSTSTLHCQESDVYSGAHTANNPFNARLLNYCCDIHLDFFSIYLYEILFKQDKNSLTSRPISRYKHGSANNNRRSRSNPRIKNNAEQYYDQRMMIHRGVHINSINYCAQLQIVG